MLAVETINLTKDYRVGFWRKRRQALDQVSLRVEAGEIFGLLGPNGAGKTTTLKLLLGLVAPTSGTARVLGRNFRDVLVHQEIGYLPENPSFYDHLTAEEFMGYAGALCGLCGRDRSGRAQAWLRQVGLGNSGGVRLRKFSKGMIQRLGIAQALIHDPDLVFLDEPMSGLDPVGRREVRNLILELKRVGKTVVFSTHILSDAETLCDRVAILDRGRLQGCGDVEEILKMDISGTELVLEKPRDELLCELEPCTSSIVHTGGRVRLILRSGVEQPRLLLLLSRWNATVVSLNPLRMSLEDYFMERVANTVEPACRETASAANRHRMGK